jgi:UDP-N-acetylglucosamine 4,6-dehydratase
MEHGSSILLTGGTGSFGKAFTRQALAGLDPERLVIYSRDELKQYEMRQQFGDDPRLRFFIGDVRDRDRLRRAMNGIDHVVHAAALKQVDTAEYNPWECIRTNVLGAQHVIDSAIDTGVKKVIALSTDKASSPVNLYGASKLCSDKLFVAGNHYASGTPTRFAVVRYGNVIGSRGSVVPLFRKLAETGVIPVTDRRMTRFWITLDQAVQLVVDGFDRMRGGEIFVPKIPSTRIVDLAEAIAPGVEIREVGIRPGEKLHEEMVSIDDARRTREFDDHYIIDPVHAVWDNRPEGGEAVPDSFSYNSLDNPVHLGVEQIRDVLVGIGELPGLVHVDCDDLVGRVPVSSAR